MLYIYHHHCYQWCTFSIIITVINDVHLATSSLLSMMYIYHHHCYQCCPFTIIITVISAVHLSSVSIVSTSLLLSTWCICHWCSLIHRQCSLLVRCHCYQHHTIIISAHYQYIITSIISISSLLSMCYICHPRPLIHHQCSLLVHRHYYQCHMFIMCVHCQYIITIINMVHLSSMSINTSSVFIVSSSSLLSMPYIQHLYYKVVGEDGLEMYIQNQQTRGPNSTWKTSHEHNNKDPNCLQSLLMPVLYSWRQWSLLLQHCSPLLSRLTALLLHVIQNEWL